MKSDDHIKVYFNSACPVCKAGIDQQKGKTTACQVEWNDVHTSDKARTEIVSDVEFVRERLHVIDESGEVKIGIDAFIVLWRHSPDEHWKATLISQPVIKQLSQIAYNLFAHFLYRWNRSKGHW